MKLENITEFIKRTTISKSTLYRFYKKYPEYWEQTRFKNNKRLFPVSHAKFFDSEIMFDENQQLNRENNSMRNVIDCLMDKDSLQSRLWFKDWSLFVTVAYTHERNKKSCFRMMHGLYDALADKYGDASEIRLFFTTEPFTNRKGYHNHFVFYCSNNELLDDVKAYIQSYLIGNRIQIEPYNKYEAGLFYMVKDGLVNDDWDILDSTIKHDRVVA